jgi:hypothetical protein
MVNVPITISAKNLGQLSLPTFCRRCFWIKLKAGANIPFQIFPGIFSSIDSYSKKMIDGWFDRHAACPTWLRGTEVVGYENPPHYSRFEYYDKESAVTLRGSPDALFIKTDRSYMIADYKTARHSAAQDALLPLYETQLNAYALIGLSMGMRISELALIYTEPVTSDEMTKSDEHHRNDGFVLKFSFAIRKVTLAPESVKPLLRTVREIANLERPPPRTEGCKDCRHLKGLVAILIAPRNSKGHTSSRIRKR